MDALPILLAALTEAVFSWSVDSLAKGELGDKAQRVLSGDPAKRAYQRSLAAAYAALCRKYPTWTACLFDEHFLLDNREVAKELSKTLSRFENPDPGRLTELWKLQFHSVIDDSSSLPIEVVSYFLSCLSLECKTESALQPFFDRRALEQLHLISKVSQDQTDILNDIRILLADGSQYLKSLVEYRKTVSEVKPTVSHRLPPREEFIGRQEELSQILRYLQPTVRPSLIVIHGPGGVGKSALACEASYICAKDGFFDLVIWTTARERFFTDEGIEVVEPDIRNLEDILEIIGRASNQPVSDLPMPNKRDAIIEVLQSTPCLIVVDNFEAVKDREIFHFLQLHIPSPSKAIITSRPQLSSGESIPLRGLPNELAKTFMRQIAERRQIDSIAEADDDVLTKICEWSGGIPLAMRWVIGRVKGPMAGVRKFVEDLPDVGDNELLQFCFHGLYEDLHASERVVLQALTTFVSPVTRTALSAVSDLRGMVLDEALTALWKKSLIEYHEATDRYSMLPLTRRYSQRQASGTRDLHIDLFYQRAAKNFSAFVKDHRFDYELLEPDVDNIISIMDWCAAHNKKEELIEIASSFTWYMGIRGMTSQRLKYAQQSVVAARQLGRESQALWIEAFDVGWVILNRGAYSDAESLYEELLMRAKELQLSRVAALCYRNLALLNIRRYDESEGQDAKPETSELLRKAANLAEESLALWRESGDEYWIAITHGTLGTIAMQQGRFDDARRQHLMAMELDERNDNREGIALAKSNLGRIAIKLGQYDEALTLIEDALMIDRELKRLQGIAGGLKRKAYVYDRLEQYEAAIEALSEAATIYRQISSMSRYNQAQQQIALLQRKIKGEKAPPLF